MVNYQLIDAAATQAFGEAIGSQLVAGDLVVLSGPLGAGKTTLTQGLGAALDVRGPVTSPTFVIARVHPSLRGGPALVHVDAYRLGGPLDIDDLDLDTPLATAGVVVEWGEGKVEQLTSDRLEIRLDRLLGEASETRTVSVIGHGERGDALAGSLANWRT